MPSATLTVIISAGQSRNPEKRELEQAVAQAAAAIPGVNVLRIPHLYDLAKEGDTFKSLRQLDGDLVLITWMYTRAAHWILDRNGILGQFGAVELKQLFDDEEEIVEIDGQDELVEQRVATLRPRGDRSIYSLDFRASSSAQEFIAEISRILAEVQLKNASSQSIPLTLFGAASVVSIEEHPARRWYPVIDFSRCTNCMECIDFCLFGVYGIDSLETIVVEQADNCRKGCPACSRVCPQNAIIFPQHKTPAIAGAPVDVGGLKIDLSKLFGAPDEGEDAAAAAIRERDEQLVLAGRQAIGAATGLNERLATSRTPTQQPDQLDDLLDQLDSLDL